jgi:hypothetical protein
VSDPATASGGSNPTAVLMTLSAVEFVDVPMLGYRLRKSYRENADTVPYVPAPQRWTAVFAAAVIINLPLFDRCKPFAQLFNSPTTSKIVASASEELAKNWQAHTTTIAQLRPQPAGDAVVVGGNDFQAMVWAGGALISAAGSVATALKLWIAGFSLEARKKLVYAQSTTLEEALAVFRPEVRSLYIPRADEYVTQAKDEAICESQKQLAERAGKRRGPKPRS